jgi:hypothetical protein
MTRGRRSGRSAGLLQHIRPAVRGPRDDVAAAVGQNERLQSQTTVEAAAVALAAPTVVRTEICRRYRVAWIGELKRVRERFYAISVERRISHPAVRLIADQAKRRLFIN